jgi:hypothetical protein
MDVEVQIVDVNRAVANVNLIEVLLEIFPADPEHTVVGL